MILSTLFFSVFSIFSYPVAFGYIVPVKCLFWELKLLYFNKFSTDLTFFAVKRDQNCLKKQIKLLRIDVGALFNVEKKIREFSRHTDFA